MFQFSPRRRGQRFPSEWLQSVLPEGPGESEQPLLGRRVAPSSHPCEEMAQGNKNMAVPNKVCLLCAEPGRVRSDWDRCKVKRPKSASDLLETRTVTSVASKEEAVVWAQNRPAAPQRLQHTVHIAQLKA